MDQITVSGSGGIMHVVFNRPERKNALTEPMYEAITQALEIAARQEETRVVLLSGAAGVFTAGNDLDDFITRPPRDRNAAVFRSCARW
jgi:enoyl-CoA hydratase/carnithine racemase